MVDTILRKATRGISRIGHGWDLVLLVLAQLLLCQQLLAAVSAPAKAGRSQSKNGVSFLILHNNDMHARFEQTSRSGGKCSPDEAAKNLCYGGFARVAYEVRRYRKRSQLPVIYLNAGDTYTGTPWFTVFKDKIAADFLNKLSPDAVSLGNHEFDENVAGLVPFLERATFPVLAANLDLSREPRLRNAPNLRNSTVLTVGGHKVGVIGYLTPTTKEITQPNNVSFIDEVTAINAEAERLKAQGINILIAVGHSGYQMDKKIAAECPEIDVVIGGHTNTFLYNGTKPDSENIDGPYPTMVAQPSGKMVPVVQAYAYTKYLGRLQVKFDAKGNLVSYNDTPLLLNANIKRARDVVDLLNVYRPNITALERDIVGYTKVQLVGRSEVCRSQECNLGNLITDAMIHARVMETASTSPYWTDAPIAFLMGGGIRGSIDKKGNGSIVGTDILTVLPFSNALYVVKITGKTIRNALEHSAYIFDKDSNGGFLQMSGVHVTYDFCRPKNSRVVSVEVRCSQCEMPYYEPLDDKKTYSVIVPLFLLLGGDGHVFHEKDFDVSQTDILKWGDAQALKEYVHQMGTVYADIEERITIVDNCGAHKPLYPSGPAARA